MTYSLIFSIASSFTEKYETWDKVDASFPKENISIYVAPGGSGVGVKAAVDGTADFGMLARDIKDKEVESLGKDYKSFEVAKDALTVSVSSKNPNADELENLDTATLQKIFDGEYTKWSQVDSSLSDDEIHVYIRDLSGGAFEVFQKAVMGDKEITPSATQSASMALPLHLYLLLVQGGSSLSRAYRTDLVMLFLLLIGNGTASLLTAYCHRKWQK